MGHARFRLAAALALTLAFGCGQERCRSATALITIALDGESRRAEQLQVDAALSTGKLMERTYAWHGEPAGTLELLFPSGYPVGQRIDVQVVARSGDRPLGRGQLSEPLQPDCSAFRLVVSDTAAPDGGSTPDAGASDPCTAAGSDGVVCAPTSNRCQRAGTCVTGHCGPITQVDDGTQVSGGQYIDRCCGGQAVKLNGDENCGGCGIRCQNGYHCISPGATDPRMFWCGCNTNADCWSNCCGTGNVPNSAAKACAPSTCGDTALCQGCPPHSTCEMTDPHYYCHY